VSRAKRVVCSLTTKMPRFPKRRFRAKPYSHGGPKRRRLFGPQQNKLPARQQFADQIGGYALNKGDTTSTKLKVFLDPGAITLGQLTSSGTQADFAIQYKPQLASYGRANDDYRLITAAWQRYKVTGATIFVGQPYTATSSGRQYYDSTVYLAVLKKDVNARITTATMRGLENCEFKLMTASNDVMRKRMKYPAVAVDIDANPQAYKSMWVQTSDTGANVSWYSFLIGCYIVNARTIPTTPVLVDAQVQLEITLDRPNYQNNNVSVNPERPTQSDLDRIEALYQKHFCKNDPEESDSDTEDIPPYDAPLCVKLLKPPAERIRARAQSAASA